MFAKNNDLNDNQKAYKDYYSKRLINVFIWEIFFIAIPLLNWISISSISKVPVQLHYFIMGVIILGIIISTVWSLYWIGKQLKQRYSTIITIVIEILFILSVFLLFWTIYGHIGIFIHVMSIYIPITLGIVSLALEIILYIFAKKILPNITLDKSEEHTAIILPHDAKKIMDVSDFPVPRLIKVLKKYHENFQIYFCLYEKDMIAVLTNETIKKIKRIWIFGHGDRGGCSLTGKYFSYEDFMTEKNENGEKLHNIQPMEYVYQCHCNPESTTPLTDYLLNNKGRLNQSVDNMPNFNDRGIADMDIENTIKNKPLLFLSWLYRTSGKILHKDLNYNYPFSVTYLINRYAEHLKKNTNDLQKEYLDYYQEQLEKAKICGKYLIFIAFLSNLAIFLLYIMQEELLFINSIVFICSGIIVVAVYLYYIVKRFNSIHKKITKYFKLPVISAIIISYLTLDIYYTILLCPVYIFAITMGIEIFYYCNESSSLKYAEKVMPYIKPHKNEDHTAVILPHDENKAMDGGDEPVQTLLEVLTKYNEDFQVYLCLSEKDMVDVLTNHYAKRIWIFGHGDRGGCCLTGKFFSYAEFMTEKTDVGWKLREVEPKEYIYQCHCNPEFTTPLTEYLLKSKGVLDPEIYPDNYPDDDKMKNYYDIGLSDMKIDNPKENILLSFDAWCYRRRGILLHEDSNYNDPLSIDYIIKKYEAHLERKSKYLENDKN